MPHVVFAPATRATTADVTPRPIIPGVEPGGSQAGKNKPVLLIRDCWLEVRNLADTGVTVETQTIEVDLKLSKEQDLSPGLLLSVGRVHAAATATASLYNDVNVEQVFAAHGTLWAPAFVGLRINFASGSPTAFQCFVHLDYDIVLVPWMDWFIMWEWLDEVPDNSREY